MHRAARKKSSFGGSFVESTANVMNTFEQIRSSVVWRSTGMGRRTSQGEAGIGDEDDAN